MPTYSFRNIKTDEIIDVFMLMSERETYLKKHPHLTQTFTSPPGIGDPFTLGRVAPPPGWNDKLKQISKEHKGNSIKFLK